MLWQFSFVNADHGVDEDQFEPGIADDAQARTHEIDIVLSDFNVDARLGLSSRTGIELLLPVRLVDVKPTFLDAAGDTIANYRSIHHRDESIVGLGDVMLRHRYRMFMSDEAFPMTLDLLLGMTFPTGETEPNPFALGRGGEAHQHVFFGTGTVGPVAGLESTYALEGWSVSGWGTVRGAPFDNADGYRGPTQITAGVGVKSGFGLDDWRFLLHPELYFETPATWDGEAARNSGRTDLIAAAGVFWMPLEHVATQLAVKLPFTVRSNGGRLRMPFLLALGASYAFDLMSER